MIGVRKGYRRRLRRNTALLAFLASGLAVLWACAGPPTLLVVLDPYEAAVLDAEGLSGSRLAEVEVPGGLQVEVLQPGAEAQEELGELLGDRHPAGVYLSPLLAAAAPAMAEAFPDTLFFLEGALPPGSGSRGNLWTVRYELAQAYAEAGRAVGRLLSAAELPPALRSETERGSPPGVAIVTVRPDKTVQREVEQFRQALVEADPAVKVEERELTSLDDRARARRTLERLREEGAGVFLLRTSTLTGFCLEVLQASGGVAIVEAAPGVGAYAEVLLLTLERDLPAAIRRMGSAAAGGTVAGAAAVRSINAPVDLRWWGLGGKEGIDAGEEPSANE